MIAVSIDGVVVDPEAATISIFDRGLLYGDGVFEVLRTWRGVPVDLDAHLDRLVASAAALALRAMPRRELAQAVRRTLAAAGDREHRIRILLTRGPGGLAATAGELGPGRAIVIVEPLEAQPEALSLAIVDWPLPRRAGPAHKTLAYLDHVLAKELARAAGADEAVRLGPDGDIRECATANVFVVSAGEVATPDLAGILPGVTRAHALAACRALAIVAHERAIAVDELRHADEVFVTSAVRGVVAVTKLDGVTRPAGPLTARIRDEVERARVVAARAPLDPEPAV